MNMIEDHNPVCLGLKRITSVTPIICSMMDVPLPNLSTTEIPDEMLQIHKKRVGSDIDKCLVYAPDAIGYFLTQKYKEEFQRMKSTAPFSIRFCSVFPPKTPVCFASMFTGALPEIHGRKGYDKAILKCETIFDAFVKAGKKVAIIAVQDSSIDLIFRERDLDYYTEKDDASVTSKTIKILQKDQHDLVIVYHQEYDDTLHRTTPISEEAIIAMNNHIDSFITLGEAFNSSWKKYNRLLLFSPDHGAHISRENGKGTHGNNIPEDMVVNHYYAIEKGKK